MAKHSRQLIGQTTLSIKHIRIFSIVGAFLIASFMLADLPLLPKKLHETYIFSRLGLQIPVCLVFFAITFLRTFKTYYQPILTIIMILLIFINYWLIIACWQLTGFAFSYEGTLLYSLFALFVFRMSFQYALAFSAIVLMGFTSLVLNFPVYGEYNWVNFGFVLISLIVCLLGVHQIEHGLKRLTRVNGQLTVISETDHLTKILNRRTYEARFNKQFKLSIRANSNICVFIVDLDFFKDYNDGYGHQKGDRVIRQQADILMAIFRRETDIVARYGGEEFIVVAANVDEQQCIELAQQIIVKWQTLKTPHGKGNASEYVSCSVGFYLETVTSSSSQETIVSRADKALYQAKSAGRGQFKQFKNCD